MEENRKDLKADGSALSEDELEKASGGVGGGIRRGGVFLQRRNVSGVVSGRETGDPQTLCRGVSEDASGKIKSVFLSIPAFAFCKKNAVPAV